MLRIVVVSGMLKMFDRWSVPGLTSRFLGSADLVYTPTFDIYFRRFNVDWLLLKRGLFILHCLLLCVVLAFLNGVWVVVVIIFVRYEGLCVMIEDGNTMQKMDVLRREYITPKKRLFALR